MITLDVPDEHRGTLARIVRECSDANWSADDIIAVERIASGLRAGVPRVHGEPWMLYAFLRWGLCDEEEALADQTHHAVLDPEAIRAQWQRVAWYLRALERVCALDVPAAL